jgi:hypothetical protein
MQARDIYVLRFWHGSVQESESWRVTVTDTRTGQKYTFADLDKLVTFFKERLEEDVMRN